MSAQPEDGRELIHLGGETSVVVPLEEYRVLRALKDRASAEAIEEAEFDAAIAGHEAWKAAGCPRAKTHEEFMAELGLAP